MISPEKLTAVILSGGLGTRLRSAIGDCPKVLAPVNHRPFLSYLLDQLLSNGFSHVLLCTGYGADNINVTFGSEYKGMTIEYSPEIMPLGTGGAIRNALPHIMADHILVMNGDSYVNVDLKTYIKWYFQNQIDFSLLLTRVPDAGRYGRVELDKNGLVKQFVEKGEWGIPGWINAGVYILNKRLFPQTPMGRSFSLEHQFFPYIIDRGLLYGFKSKSSFIDIGIPASYNDADQFFKVLETK